VREQLFIQFNGDEPVQCQLMDSNGQPAADRYRGGLADITSFSDNRQVVVVIPSDNVLYFHPEVPRTATARLRQAIPYLLEDNLLEPVEHYHFALGKRSEVGRMPVAVIPDALMVDWQARFHEASIHPAVMVTDVLCLPWQQGQWTLYLDDEQVRLRSGEHSGLVSEWDNLPLLIAGLLKENETPPERVVVYAEDPTALEPRLEEAKAKLAEAGEVEWTSHQAELFELCIHNFRDSGAINLLQGPYKYKREFNRQLGPWRLAASLVAGLLLLWLADYALGYWRLSRELHWLDAQITEEIHKGFPEIKTIRQPLNQVNVVMGQLRGQSGSSLYSQLMMAMGKALQASPGTLQEIHYRNERLVVELQFPDLQSVNSFEQRLQGQQGIAVKVLSANKKDAFVLARVQISGGGI
jgi:general secretion pathway protein L